MTDTYYLAMKLLRTPGVMTPVGELDLALPAGCVGIVYAFVSPEAAAQHGYHVVQEITATPDEEGGGVSEEGGEHD